VNFSVFSLNVLLSGKTRRAPSVAVSFSIHSTRGERLQQAQLWFNTTVLLCKWLSEHFSWNYCNNSYEAVYQRSNYSYEAVYQRSMETFLQRLLLHFMLLLLQFALTVCFPFVLGHQGTLRVIKAHLRDVRLYALYWVIKAHNRER
jgi:hypothetical protein